MRVELFLASSVVAQSTILKTRVCILHYEVSVVPATGRNLQGCRSGNHIFFEYICGVY